MEVCYIIVIFLIAILIYTHYTIEYQVPETNEQQTVSQLGSSLSSHDSVLRPTRI